MAEMASNNRVDITRLIFIPSVITLAVTSVNFSIGRRSCSIRLPVEGARSWELPGSC